MAERVRSAAAVDFGTSTSLVAYRTGRRPPELVRLSPSVWLPSVATLRRGRFVVGEEADSIGLTEPELVIRSAKRAITHGHQAVRVGEQDVPVDNVIVAILTEVRKRANRAGRALGRLRELRLGCPAMWDGEQRRRILDLATRAGLPVSDSTLIDEPVAAGVSWLADRYLHDPGVVEGRLLVFDMGGGTVDVAVMNVVGGERPDVTVLASLGLPIAGDNLDELIAGQLEVELADRGLPMGNWRNPRRARGQLRFEARRAKESLSRQRSYPVNLLQQLFGPVPELRYSRERLEDAFAPIMADVEKLIWAAARAARLTERYRDSGYDPRSTPDALAGDIDHVLLAGGMSRIPYVARRIGELFPEAKVYTHAGVEPDEAIVAGLTDTAGYDRINLHRPAFDFVLEWDGGRRRHTLYHAYTPLYTMADLLSGRFRLNHEVLGRGLGTPTQGTGHMRVVSAAGLPVALSVDGIQIDRLPVRFGPHNVIFKVYCDGHVVLQDGIGRQTSLRVDRWPVIRGRDDAALAAKTTAAPPPDPPTAWYLDKEWSPPPARSGPRRE